MVSVDVFGPVRQYRKAVIKLVSWGLIAAHGKHCERNIHKDNESVFELLNTGKAFARTMLRTSPNRSVRSAIVKREDKEGNLNITASVDKA